MRLVPDLQLDHRKSLHYPVESPETLRSLQQSIVKGIVALDTYVKFDPQAALELTQKLVNRMWCIWSGKSAESNHRTPEIPESDNEDGRTSSEAAKLTGLMLKMRPLFVPSWDSTS